MVTPGLAAAVLSRSMHDVFNTPKLLTVAFGACVLTGLAAVAAIRGHRVPVPSAAPVAAAGVFIAVATAATLLSTSPLRSLFGASGSRAGLVLYAGCAVVFAGAATLYRGRSPGEVIAALLLAAAPIGIYGGVQALHLDPLPWRSSAGGPLIFSTFGNANFFSAWAGIVAVLAVWGAVSRTWRMRWRVACAVLAALLVAVALASQSIQGPLAAVAGVVVFAVAHATGRGAPRWRSVVGGALVLGAGGVAAVVASRGDAAGSLATRVGKWEAAVAMGRARPLSGFGLDLFGDWYHALRPLSDAVDRGLTHTADAAHSVPLHLLAGGGVPLLIAYAAFAVAVAVAAVRGLRRTAGEQRLLIAALAGAWAAYHVQAMVSIDVPPLAVLHWLLAGLLVAAVSTREEPVPHPPHAPWSPAAALAVTVAACLVLGMFTVPVRSELAARRALRFALQDRHASAERSFAIALRLSPWEPRFALALARERLHRGDERLALDAYALAAGRSPRGMIIALERARATHQVGTHADAVARYDDALVLDPQSPHLQVEAARHHLRWGDHDAAVRLLERAVAAEDRAPWRRMLERAREAPGTDSASP